MLPAEYWMLSGASSLQPWGADGKQARRPVFRGSRRRQCPGRESTDGQHGAGSASRVAMVMRVCTWLTLHRGPHGGARGPRLRMGLSGEDTLNQGAGSGAGVQPRGPPAARMATLPATRCGTAENTVWVKTRLFQTEPAPGLWRWLRVSSSRKGSCSSAEKTRPRGLVSPVDRGTVPGKRTLREEKGDLLVLKWGWGDRLALLFYKITEHTPFF